MPKQPPKKKPVPINIEELLSLANSAVDEAKKAAEMASQMVSNIKKSKKHPGRRGDPLSAYPLTPEQLVRGIFQIKPEDVKKIVASKPGKKAN